MKQEFYFSRIFFSFSYYLTIITETIIKIRSTDLFLLKSIHVHLEIPKQQIVLLSGSCITSMCKQNTHPTTKGILGKVQHFPLSLLLLSSP